MNTHDVWLAIFLMWLITFSVRALPFFLLEFFRHNRVVMYLGAVLPPSVMLILVIFSIQDTSFIHFPYGFPEIFGILATIGVHLYKRDAFLSIFLGTTIYALTHYLFFTMLFP